MATIRYNNKTTHIKTWQQISYNIKQYTLKHGNKKLQHKKYTLKHGNNKLQQQNNTN